MKAANILVFLVIAVFVPQIRGHGMMFDPPSRSSMWRFGYPVPPNYSDNEVYCGGQHQDEAGSNCGVCGDAKGLARPRPNENGGKYGLGIITKNYQPGGTIPITVKLSANHLGYFQFTMCNLDSGSEDESCFRPLTLSDGSSKWSVPNIGGGVNITLSLRAPSYSCKHCVLRWHYRSGNTWGICEDGHGANGCGPQETFRNCADVSVGGYKEAYPQGNAIYILEEKEDINQRLLNQHKKFFGKH